MPKPKYGKPTWKNQYSEHDYRGGGDTRRVSFKTNRHGKKDKDWSASVRAHLQDEDIDMGGTSGSVRTFSKKYYKGKKSHRSGSPAPNQHNRRKLFDSPMGWFRVLIPYGNKYEKDFILRTLLQKVEPLPFWPVSWKINGNAVTFFVDNFALAEKLYELDRQIQFPDGFRMNIRVQGGTPNVEITPEVKEKIKLAMAKRYNAVTKALDLTKFHADPGLQDYFCALFKPIAFLTVIDIIAENIPELEAINLHDNRIANLSYLKKVNEKLPNLKILHLGNNKFRDVSMLDPLVGLPIVDLVLNGNPLCSRFKDQELYIGEVRKRFPKVMKLDGVDLPPPIGFDVAEEIPLPPARQTLLCSQEGESIVRQFLEQYFLIYDTENRQPLIQAYHESALFSMTMAYPYGQKDKNTNWLDKTRYENRNLMRMDDSDQRNKMLKQGQVAVVSYLQSMPLTKHDIHSFTVDLVLFTPQMLTLTVSGLFKELKTSHKTPPIRAFFKTLVIVPAGTGFCISNETLHITNATDEQAKHAFKAPVVPVPAAPAPVAPDVVPVPDDVTKQQMVQAMCEQSGMNLEWSGKCLVESQWDYARAINAFTNLHKQGVIPAEAFVK